MLSGRLVPPGRTGGQPCEQMASLESNSLMVVLEEGRDGEKETFEVQSW